MCEYMALIYLNLVGHVPNLDVFWYVFTFIQADTDTSTGSLSITAIHQQHQPLSAKATNLWSVQMIQSSFLNGWPGPTNQDWPRFPPLCHLRQPRQLGLLFTQGQNLDTKTNGVFLAGGGTKMLGQISPNLSFRQPHSVCIKPWFT